MNTSREACRVLRLGVCELSVRDAVVVVEAEVFEHPRCLRQAVRDVDFSEYEDPSELTVSVSECDRRDWGVGSPIKG